MEYTNFKYVNACLVWILPLNQFKENIHSIVTDAKRALKLSDILDLPIGHVLMSLAELFHSVLDEEGEIFAEANEETSPTLSTMARAK